jgi:ADP-ribosylglycohydrolase
MFHEIAIADAYGQAFEFIKNPKESGLKNVLVDGGLVFQQNPKYPDLRKGWFTDDTIRSIACRRMMFNHRYPQLLNIEEHFKAIVNNFWEFYRKGWSGRFQKFLEENQQFPVEDYHHKIVRKNTNGAVMGILPFGYFKEIYQVKNVSAIHAFSTHSHETIPYAQALALCVWFLRNNAEETAIPKLRKFLEDNVEGLYFFLGDANKMTSGDTFNVVLRQIEKAYMQGFTMEELIIDCVSLGGDTDSICALCAGIYSHSYLYKRYGGNFVKNHLDKIESGNSHGLEVLAILEQDSQ